jgi:hypothetical protein
MTIRCTHLIDYEIQITIPVTVSAFISGARDECGNWVPEQTRVNGLVAWIVPDQGLDMHLKAPADSTLSAAFHIRQFIQDLCRSKWDEITKALDQAEQAEDEAGIRDEIH